MAYFPDSPIGRRDTVRSPTTVPERNRLIEYIKAQEAHHETVSFLDEFRKLLIESGIEFDERFLV